MPTKQSWELHALGGLGVALRQVVLRLSCSTGTLADFTSTGASAKTRWAFHLVIVQVFFVVFILRPWYNMSGDVSEYVRAKAQDRLGPDATFMKDGYARWAESEAPLRVGGAAKMGDEKHSGRHRSSKHLHKYLKDQKIHGGVGLGKPHSNPFHEHRGRHRDRRHRLGGVYEDASAWGTDTDSSSSSDSDSSSSSDGGPMARMREKDGGPMARMREKDDYYSSSSDSDTSMDEDEERGARKKKRRAKKRKEEEDEEEERCGKGPPRVLYKKSSGRRRRGRRSRSSSSASSDSSDSSVSSSSSDASDMKRQVGASAMYKGFHGRHRRQKEKKGGNVKSTVDAAFRFWYEKKILGTPLANWSTVPSGIKDFVTKIHDVWTVLEKYAPQIKQVLKAGKVDKVVAYMEKLGFGKHGLKRKQRAMVHAQFLHKMLKGGDAFDDKLSSMSLKGLYDTAKSLIPSKYATSVKQFDAGVRGAYNAYDAVKKNADKIMAVTDKIPAPVGPDIRSMIEKVKGGAAGVKDEPKDPGIPPMAAAPMAGPLTIPKGVLDQAKEDKKEELGVKSAAGKGRKGKRKPSERNMMVSKLMREEGLSLGEASKKVSAMMKKKKGKGAEEQKTYEGEQKRYG